MDQKIFNNLIWLNTKEASEYLRISENALRLMVFRETVPYYKLGKRLRFKKHELNDLMEFSPKQGEDHVD